METVRTARARHFASNGFSEAQYYERWVKVQLGPIPLVFPNFPARRRAIPLHDLHHIATGYATTWVGEGEISAWELGGGCAGFAAGWLFALGGFGGGLFLAPRRTYRAFVRGRHGINLYHEGSSDDLLDLTLDELRARMQLEQAPAPATWRDQVAFAGWIALLSMPLVAVAVAVLK